MVRTGSVVTATFLVCAVILCYSAMAYGEGVPQITGAPSMIEDRQSVTIAGANFGTKSQGPPLLWEDFEWGVGGDPISKGGWTHYQDGDPIGEIAEISSTKGCSGTRSAYALLCGDKGHWRSGYKQYTNSLEIYVTYMFSWACPSPKDEYGPLKYGKISAAGSVYYGPPKLVVSDDVDANWWNGSLSTDVEDNGDAPYYTFNTKSLSQNVWHRIEFWLVLSDPPGEPNGSFGVWVDFQKGTPRSNWWSDPELDWENIVTRNVGVTNKLNTFLSSHTQSGGKIPLEVWNDDVYVDNTRARVEIGNASTWGACTSRVIQVPTTWSSDSIRLTVNQASFGQGETAYLYVVDENGNVNENGFEIKFAEGGPDTAAPYPAYHSPTKGATDVPIDANISFHVIDSGAGVDRSSIVVTVGEQTVQPAISGSPSDYVVTYDPPTDFGYNEKVTVTIDARDLASPPNAMRQEVYSFTTARQLAPPGKPVHVD